MAQITGDQFKKTWLSLKGISCLQEIFVLIWMKQTLIWFNLQRDGSGNGLSNIKDTFAESLRLQMSVLHQSMCIFKAGGLSSSFDGWAKYKEKVPDVRCVRCQMCQISIKMLKQHAIPNSRFIHQKGTEKLIKDEPRNSKYSNFQQKISVQIMGFCFNW